MTQLRLFASSQLDLPSDSYIYNLVPLSPSAGPASFAPLGPQGRLAALCSDDSVRILDSTTLNQVPGGALKNVNDSVTCLKAFAAPGEQCNVLATTGRDGRVRFWDLRTSKNIMEAIASTERQDRQSLSALEVDSVRNCIVAGSELEGKDGPGDAPIFVWDSRNLGKPQHMYTESHTDTITELKFHPSHPSLLLTASTDSLINLIDVTNPDEDEAVYQVINHKSAVHHAGFLDDRTVYGLGTDETLSFYRVQSQDENAVEPDPVVLGDVREGLEAEYVVDIVHAGSEAWIAAGKHSSRQLELVLLKASGQDPKKVEWAVMSDMARLRISDAHGEEIVRDVYVDASEQPTVYTCGEDGAVRAWRSATEADAMAVDEPLKKKPKKDKDKAKRFKPY